MEALPEDADADPDSGTQNGKDQFPKRQIAGPEAACPTGQMTEQLLL
jgi:hypothetical protein